MEDDAELERIATEYGAGRMKTSEVYRCLPLHSGKIMWTTTLIFCVNSTGEGDSNKSFGQNYGSASYK